MSNMEGRGPAIPPENFESIEEAVLESPRGRWFLSEYANRVRAREFKAVADNVKSLETAVNANHEAIMSRIAQALAQTAPGTAGAAPELAPRHMKYFKRDEEIFEAVPQAEIAIVKPAPEFEPRRGAKLTIRRLNEPAVTVPETVEPEPVMQIVADIAPPPEMLEPRIVQPAMTEETPKRRIVIIRHKPGETVDVPLQNEMAEAS